MKQVIRSIGLGVFVAGSLFMSGMAKAEGLITFKQLSPETALTLAKATLEACRDRDYQVAVAVVTRSGDLQVLLRDQYAGTHTSETAHRKAYTAVSFRGSTMDLAENTKAGEEASGARDIPMILMLGGGVLVEAEGSIVGGVGVSGAPSGQADDDCAQDGIEAIMDIIAF
jgi:uncharacterized protein GlcG (DUF336 family)